MKTVILKRDNFLANETLGTLIVDDWTCKTLELAWIENKNNVSCIPSGTYSCKWTRSNRLSTLKGYDFFTYEILNVPDRAGIRIHSANYFHDLLGCIALGKDYQDINGDGTTDLISSKATVDEFNKLMNQEDFELTIS